MPSINHSLHFSIWHGYIIRIFDHFEKTDNKKINVHTSSYFDGIESSNKYQIHSFSIGILFLFKK